MELEFVYGQGEALQAVNAMVADISRTDIPVLIVGESGTGKEVYARLIHRLSGAADAPLKKLNCTTLEPGQLLRQTHEGVRAGSDSAPAGTLLLDGVDELDLACQRVLLSLLPDGQPKATDGARPARVISTSTRILEQEVTAGRFRRELYFRINGVCLRLPALRERKEDIPALTEHFLAKHARELRKKIPALGGDTLELLTSYAWPGNIRELENVARKMVAFEDVHNALGDLREVPAGHPEITSGAGPSSLKVAARAASRRTERELILRALERTHWNRKRAALELQISYKSLLYKIKQIGEQGSDSKG